MTDDPAVIAAAKRVQRVADGAKVCGFAAIERFRNDLKLLTDHILKGPNDGQ